MELRFGIIGLGRAAAATVPAIAQHPNTSVVAAADTNAEVRQAFCQQYSARGYDRIQDLCQDPEVDAVYIATPMHLHTEHVLVAVSAGKQVICEYWLYRPRLPAEQNTQMGGGVVFRQGAHHFDIVRLIGGGVLRSVRATTGVWDPPLAPGARQ